MKEIQALADGYALELLEFKRGHQGLESLLGRPDYLAIQVADMADFDRLYEAHQPESFEIGLLVDVSSDRITATAELLGTYVLQTFGTVKWLQIINRGADLPKNPTSHIDHVGFLFEDLEYAQSVLDRDELGFTANEQVYESPHLAVEFGTDLVFRLNSTKMEDVYVENDRLKLLDVWKKPIVPDKNQ